MSRRTQRTSKSRWTATATLIVCCAAVAGMSGFGCASDDSESTGQSGQCLSNRAFFAQKVWAPVMNKICIKCHSPDGVATEQNAKLLLLPSSYPGFLDANLASVAEIVKIEYDGKSELLRKPLGEMEHGGGVQIEPGSPEYEALAQLVERLNAGETCPDGNAVASFDDVVMHDALGTLRKASLELVGRLPNQTEVEAVLADGDAALPGALDGMMKEDAFYARLKEIFNDLLLTDRYMGYTGYALNLLNKDDYPNAGDAWFELLSDDEKKVVNRSVAREPLELIAYIVKNERPFSDVLTAKYTLMNPFSAKVFNSNLQFSNPNDENEWKEGQIVALREGAALPIPHSGVLTSPMFLNRFPTTPTNRNRHRARMVFKHFLATDILRIAERPIDPTQATNYANPTREDAACNVCHRQIDPIAGAFQKWDDNDQEEYQPDKQWHDEMFPPGFGKEVMQVSDYGDALGWLATRVVADPRFSLAAVYTVFEALTGQKPVEYPPDSEAPDFAHQLAAWDAQDAAFRNIGDKFVADGFNLKTVVREVVLSPYFRARNATGVLSPEREVELASVGTGRLVIPEVLGRKIKAITGRQWGTNTYYGTDYLGYDYRILYGGIDSEDVTARLTEPNGVMANVAWRMANEVSCQSTAWDFSRPTGERKLFPYVALDDLPEDETGAPNAEAVARIKQNIRYLHAHIAGEALAENDPEIERTYGLFLETWKEGKAKLETDELSDGLQWSCRARVDPYTGQDLPDAEKIEQDPDYAVRAWMSVVTYLLADWGFLYE